MKPCLVYFLKGKILNHGLLYLSNISNMKSFQIINFTKKCCRNNDIRKILSCKNTNNKVCHSFIFRFFHFFSASHQLILYQISGVKSDESAECIVYQSSFITVIESRLVYLFQVQKQGGEGTLYYTKAVALYFWVSLSRFQKLY